MWLFLPESFLSIVQNKADTSKLVVRARREGDIESIFPRAKVYTLPGRDYQFRADLDRTEVADAMHREVMTMTQTNFKDSVDDNDYHNACSQVWSVMSKLQPVAPFSSGYNAHLRRGRAPSQKGLGFGSPVAMKTTRT